jgi:hypothetical protein
MMAEISEYFPFLPSHQARLARQIDIKDDCSFLKLPSRESAETRL